MKRYNVYSDYNLFAIKTYLDSEMYQQISGHLLLEISHFRPPLVEMLFIAFV